MRKLLTLALGLLPSLALAQSASLPFTDLSRGLNLPPVSSAFSDEATAASVNPAGLIHVGGAELVYLHERSIARNQVGDGVYVADSFFKLFALGLSVEWLRSTTYADTRKTTWSMAFGSPELSLGLGLNLFNSWEEKTLTGLASLSLGLQSRPLRWLAVGASVQNVDQPERGVVTLPRRINLGIGFRPLHERLTLGLDYLLRTDSPWGRGLFQGTVQGELTPGIVLGVSVARGIQRDDDFRVQGAITLNTSHFGATYSYGTSRGGPDHVFGVRLSEANYSTLKLAGGKVALFDVDDLLASSSGPLALLGGPGADPFLELTEFLDRSARDPELRGVVLKISGLPHAGLGKAEELRQAVLRLRHSGKTVIAVLLSGGDTEYFVASAADKVFVVPQALLSINGFEAQLTFLGDTMSKVGVHWDVARVGAYKNAPDQLMRGNSSPEQREAVNGYLDTDVRVVDAAVTGARHITAERFHEAQALGLVTAKKALEFGLVDGVVDSDQLDDRVGELIAGAHVEMHYRPPGFERRWGSQRRIALIPVLGDIAGGKSRADPLGLAQIAGAETVVRALKQAEEDPSVAAIILRVDSGGGDGLASDLMYRAVLSAEKKKPVIASMGDVAASGGYYAAMGADTVFASPTTITGSIGVFVLKPALQELAEKLGVHQESIKRGPLSDIMGLYRPWTPDEQKAAQAWVDGFYDDFITEVAHSRKLSKAQVDTIARGRVWSGADAQARGLVDTLGGLWDALDEARRRGHVSAGEDVEIALYGEPHGLLSSLGGEEGALAKTLGLSAGGVFPESLRVLARELGVSTLTLAQPGIKAMMPFDLTVR